MKWSAIKKQWRELAASDSIDIHVTGYRQAHDGAGEFWITLDRIKIFGVNDYSESGSVNRVIGYIKEYLSMDIGLALESDNETVRLFALMDRRVGKRRLVSYTPKNESEVVICGFRIWSKI